MKTCVLHAATDLRIEDRPVQPLEAHQVRIQFGVGGICGSDLHYYFDGRVGDFAVQEPLILGHEMAGDVVEVGDNVIRTRPGDRVTVNPSTPCRHCRFCINGRENLCSNMRFLGSASVNPHVQGAFQEYLTVWEHQCYVVPKTLSYDIAACAEPLAVCLHAVSRAGPLLGKSVLVTGSGPIGALIVLVAKHAGAQWITVTDIVDPPLAVSQQVGASEVVNISKDGSKIDAYQQNKGFFDVALEASGNPKALDTCLLSTRPGGRVVQVGMLPPGYVDVPVNKLMAKELDFVGSFRFHEEFGWAVEYLINELVDVSPILTGQFSVSDIDNAFKAAANRNEMMKVQIVF